jgi:hypothetical protein
MPPELQRIVARALEKDRDLRYRLPATMLADLKRLRRDILGRSGSQHPAAAPPARSAVNSRALTIVATVATVIALGVVELYFTRPRGAGAPAPAADSFASLQVTQLTSTGNAFRPAVSPDGKYVVYLQIEETGVSLWLRQLSASSSVRLVAADGPRSPQAATVGPDGTFVDFVRGGGIFACRFSVERRDRSSSAPIHRSAGHQTGSGWLLSAPLPRDAARNS